MAELPNMQRTYKVWAADDVVYGPIDFPLLSQWVREARVARDNWVFTEQTESWARAADLPELGLHFEEAGGLLKPGTINGPIDPLIPGVPVGTLQQVDIFKNMTDRQRGRFAQCMEVQKFTKFETLVKEGIRWSGVHRTGRHGARAQDDQRPRRCAGHTRRRRDVWRDVPVR